MTDPTNGPMGRAPSQGGRAGRYSIEDPIGSGGNAAVFRARDPDGQPVAVKVLHPSAVDAEEVERFKREFRALSRMNHPNIVRVIEAGVQDGYPWIAMELVDGHDLGERIQMWAADPPADRFEQAERILRGMCSALQSVHDHGLVHRDIKPSNVLIGADGEPKISDFGVVKDSESEAPGLTMAGHLVGTVAFMAPEQITNEPVDRRTDLYSLGAVLYNMLTGRRPIEAKSVAGYLAKHLTEVPLAPTLLDPEVPRRMEHIAQRLLMKDPSQRYPSARAVLQALDREDDPDTPPLRGRHHQSTLWSAQLRSMHDGAGGSVALEGPPGSGKSYTLQSMVEHARAEGFQVAQAAGSARNLITALLLDLGEDVSEVPVKKHLRLLALRVRGKPTVLAVDDLDTARERMIGALARLLQKLVGAEGEPLVLLYTASQVDGVLYGLYNGSDTGMPSDRVLLEPLERQDIVSMMRDRGVSGPVAPVLGRRLHRELNGLPGPAAQQLHTLHDQGWFQRTGDSLKPTRPVEDFAKAIMPVPSAVRRELEAQLNALDPAELHLANALALLGRPAASELLGRITGEPEPERVARRMLRQGLFHQREADEQSVLEFTHPSMGNVARVQLSDGRQRELHAAIAKALRRRRRRREGAVEVANHLRLAHDSEAAYPLYVQAARRAAREGDHGKVLELCALAESLLAKAEPSLEPTEAVKLRRWLYMLRGEAKLARANWGEALLPLRLSVEAARALDEPAALARTLGSLGRAHYRLGRFDRAAPFLQEALDVAPPGASVRGPATRALADIKVRQGNFDGAQTHWEEALQLARASGSQDAEARARRGLAHVRAFQGAFEDASELLDQADDLLNPEGDPRVRAGIMARAIELDNAAGRFGSALYRCELLTELVQRAELPERLAEAYALTAEALILAGRTEQATEAVHHAVNYLRAQADSGSWSARLLAARVLCALGRNEEALATLPANDALASNVLDDPAAQAAAIRARATATTHPANALDLARWCLVRPEPLMVIRHARICVDCCYGLASAGDVPSARRAAKRGLLSMASAGCDGLRLEVLLAFEHASPDPRIVEVIGEVAKRIAHNLSPQLAKSFSQRARVAEALTHIGFDPSTLGG